MANKIIGWGILMLAIVALIANAAIAWTPTSNIDGRNFYTIFNFSNVSAAKIFDSGSRVLTNQTVLNVNSSVWWDNENNQSNLNVNRSLFWDEETSQANLNVNSSHFWAELAATTEITALGTISTGLWQATQIADAYIAALNANKLTNIAYLNYKILSYWANITDRPGYLSNFTDDIDYSTKNVNRSTFWGIFSGASDLNDKVLSKWENITNRPTYLSNFTDNLDYSNKNVNSSQYWKELSVPADLNGRILVYWINITDRPNALSFFTDDLGARGYTLLSNFTDNLGARGYTLLSNFTDDLVYSNKNVNSSVYWGTLQNPSDLNGRVLVYWVNISDAPTALSFFTDDLGARGYTLLSNFTDNLGARGYTLLSNFTDDIDYSSKNTNSSQYWKELSVPADLNGRVLSYWENITNRPTSLSEFTDNLGARGYTLLSNFSDDLGARGYTLLSNFTDDLVYSNKNVNSSVYWDGISSQSEITHTGNLSSLNVTGNVTAPWFNGQILWEFIAGKFITAVGKFFYVDSGTLQLNTTELNSTIDSRVAVASNLSVAGGIKLDGTTFSVEAGNGLEQETNGLKVADAGINDTLMKYKLGQNLTLSDAPTFTNLTLTGKINPEANLTFGKGWIIPQGEYGCFDASCNHYIFENSTGVLIIV